MSDLVPKDDLPSRNHYHSGLYDTPETFIKPSFSECVQFLEELRKCGIPSVAARTLGRGEVAFQIEKSSNPEFSSAWDWAIRESTDSLEEAARIRAVDGVTKEIFFRGSSIGEVTEYSDALLALLLKANHPKYNQIKNSEEGDSSRSGQVTQINVRVFPKENFITPDAVSDVETQ